MTEKKTSRLCVLLLCLTMCLTLLSCDNTRVTSETASNTEATTTKPVEKTELTVYADASTYEMLEYLSNSYSSGYQNVVINISLISDSDECSGKLNSELLEGGGPDLVMVSDSMRLNLPELIESQAFADIKQLNEQYAVLDMSEFNEKILEAGVFGDRQLFLPIFYSLPIICGVDDYITEAGAVLDGSFSDFAESLKNYDGIVFEYLPTFSDIYVQSGLDFIDIDEKSCEVDNERIKELVNAYCSMYSELYSNTAAYIPTDKSYRDLYGGALAAEDFLFINTVREIGGKCNIDHIDEVYRELAVSGLDTRLAAFPGSSSSAGISASVGWYLGINAGTENADKVLSFINYILDYTNSSFWASAGIPVCLAYNQNIREKAYGLEVNYILPHIEDEFVHGLVSSIDKTLLDEYYSLADNIGACTLTDKNIMDMLDKIIEDILKNGMSVDDALALAQNDILNYIK